MTKKTSTAWFIPYELRPSKQIERKLVLDCLLCCRVSEPGIGDLPFVGMGGFRFIDFLLAHKILGTTLFESIEHDSKLIPRCEHNKPFETVTVHNKTAYDYINDVGFSGPAVVWLDYEKGIREDLLADVSLLCANVRPKSFVFCTISAEVDHSVVERDPRRIKDFYVSHVNKFADSFPEKDFDKKIFYITSAKILLAMFKFGLGGRADGTFFPFVRVAYKDTRYMVTVGGYFGENDVAERMRGELEKRCSFLNISDDSFVYLINQFNVSEAERRLLDRAALSPEEKVDALRELEALGFEKYFVGQYKCLMRYVPRYFESLM